MIRFYWNVRTFFNEYIGLLLFYWSHKVFGFTRTNLSFTRKVADLLARWSMLLLDQTVFWSLTSD